MSMNLDARQRAMLLEMGVRVWQPQAPTAPAAQAVPVAAPEPTAVVLPAQAKPHGVHTLNWGELQSAVSACEACGLCQSRQHTVFGTGSAPARWLIVGEAPGEQEDLQGQPFVGPAGQLLDNMLKAVGLSRGSDVFITNVLKCRPPANRNPQPDEMAQCAPYLQRQIELVQPTVILALGRFAAQSLLQSSLPEVASIPLGKLRGQIHGYENNSKRVPVVVSYHPAYLLRAPADKAKAWADWCLALATAPHLAATSD